MENIKKDSIPVKSKIYKHFNMKEMDKFLIIIIVLFSTLKREQDVFNNAIIINIFNYVYMVSFFILIIRTIKLKNDYTKYNIALFSFSLLMILVEIIALLFNGDYSMKYGIDSIKRAGITIISSILVPVMIYTFTKAAKEKVINYIAIGYIINQILVMIARTSTFGLVKAFQDITGSFSIKGSTSSIFEIHMATYCLGLLAIYYLWIIINNIKEKQANNKKIIVCFLGLAFFFFIGNKRIALLAFILSSISMLIILKIKINKRKIFSFYMIIMILLLSYIGIIYNGKFYSVTKSIGINTSGRTLLYKYVTNKSEFSLKAMPWGLGTVNLLLEKVPYQEIHKSYIAVALHNDLLRTYIEFGFFGFILWISIVALYIPDIIHKTYNVNSLKIYYVLLIYAFVIFSMSNAYYFTNVQSLLFIIPMIVTDNKEREKDEQGKKL